MDKKKAIFVDDEPNILDGLRRTLRSLRNQYDLQFVGSGHEALEMMAESRYDVVISDMRMPGMDGAQLLEIVQQQYPHTIRVMLTGQADEESIMRTIGVVHQFLAKPCDPGTLKAILIQTAALQDILCDGKLKDLISQIGTLPSLPATYEKLRKTINSVDVEINELGKIIGQDMAMSAKVLQLVNSAFFGIYSKVDSPTRAVQLLGLDTIKVLVLGLELFAQTKPPTDILPLDKLWFHSLAVGKIAKSIADSQSGDSTLVSNAFLAGILHDIGKLVLASSLPAQYLQVIALAGEKNVTLQAAEQSIFGSGQSGVGAYLMGLWGFSTAVIEAICFQSSLESYPVTSFSPALAVHVANVLYYQHRPDEIVGRKQELNLRVIDGLGLQGRIGEWGEICAENLQTELEI
ncbi:MAG: response regulator [Pseudomonadota bacterium]